MVEREREIERERENAKHFSTIYEAHIMHFKLMKLLQYIGNRLAQNECII